MQLHELGHSKKCPVFAEEVWHLVSLSYLRTDACLQGLRNQKGAYEAMTHDPHSFTVRDTKLILHPEVLGLFPISCSINKYILAIMDLFTRWVQAFSIPEQGAKTVRCRSAMSCYAFAPHCSIIRTRAVTLKVSFSRTSSSSVRSPRPGPSHTILLQKDRWNELFVHFSRWSIAMFWKLEEEVCEIAQQLLHAAQHWQGQQNRLTET